MSASSARAGVDEHLDLGALLLRRRQRGELAFEVLDLPVDLAHLDLRVEDGLLRLGEALADQAEELRPVGLRRRRAVGRRRAASAAAPGCRSASSAPRPPARPPAARALLVLAASRWHPRCACARWRRPRRRCAARTCGGCRPSRSRACRVALPSTRIELAIARAGRSANRMTWSPRSSLTLPIRVTSAPEGKTVTASMREVPLTSAA